MTKNLVVGLGLSALILTGCGESLLTELANKTATITDSQGNPTTGVVTNDGFYVRVFNENKFSYYIQDRSKTFGTECSIDYNAANRTLHCDLRMPELDLYFQPLKIQFNVPSGMCSYIVEHPYSFLNRPVKNHGNVTAVVNQKDLNCTLNGAASGTYSSGNCTFTDWTALGSGTAQSNFDYSGNGGPNCAAGKWLITVIDSTGKPTPYSGSFGGLVGNCVAGPGKQLMSGWPVKDGIPLSLVSEVQKTGLNKVWEMRSPIEAIGNGSNIIIANGFNYNATFRGGAPRHTTLGSTALPIAQLNPYYLACLDQAFEIKHQIFLWIHEFNTMTEFKKWGTSSGATGSASSANPDDSSSCTEEGSANSCNDLWDWDDLVDGSYPLEGAIN